ncbi:MAG: hypothetical protein A2007_04320 [Verrucomicrobia bacterium GWC2_42_7]|nr:MAG: hypothetical protein A2007_04320 [Verrucomicrobia bacterium GWC2_42_7]
MFGRTAFGPPKPLRKRDRCANANSEGNLHLRNNFFPCVFWANDCFRKNGLNFSRVLGFGFVIVSLVRLLEKTLN